MAGRTAGDGFAFAAFAKHRKIMFVALFPTLSTYSRRCNLRLAAWMCDVDVYGICLCRVCACAIGTWDIHNTAKIMSAIKPHAWKMTVMKNICIHSHEPMGLEALPVELGDDEKSVVDKREVSPP